VPASVTVEITITIGFFFLTFKWQLWLSFVDNPYSSIMAPDLSYLTSTDAAYPQALRRYLSGEAPATLTAQGNLHILSPQQQRPLFALFCSIQCPPALILQTYELARALRDAGVTVISGFHSPMEKECLAILLEGTQPVILCPARSLDTLHIRPIWKAALKQGRLLLLSPFTEEERRPTTNRAQERNALVAALADIVFVAHAMPGGKTEKFCQDVLAWQKPVLTLDSHENAHLFSLGINIVRPEQIGKQGELFVVDEEE
jgi:predicted Rossmann fold nucleotide-binding protein DprA/Smf involved in DNA uptake